MLFFIRYSVINLIPLDYLYNIIPLDYFMALCPLQSLMSSICGGAYISCPFEQGNLSTDPNYIQHIAYLLYIVLTGMTVGAGS